MDTCMICHEQGEDLINLHPENSIDHAAHSSCIICWIVSSSFLICPVCNTSYSTAKLMELFGENLKENGLNTKSFFVSLARSGKLDTLRELEPILLDQDAEKSGLRVAMLEAAIRGKHADVASHLLMGCQLSGRLASSLVKIAARCESYLCVMLFVNQLFADKREQVEFYNMVVSVLVEYNHAELLEKLADELDARGVLENVHPSSEAFITAVEMKYSMVLRVSDDRFPFEYDLLNQNEFIIAAARCGHIDELERWIMKIGLSDETCKRAMLAALTTCQLESIQVLSEKGRLKEIPLTALENVVMSTHGMDILNYLFEAGLVKKRESRVEKSEAEETSATHLLELAAEVGQLETTIFLHKKLCIKPNSLNPMIAATKHGHVDIVTFYLQNQDNLDLASLDYALYWAARNGRLLLVKAFIQDSRWPFPLASQKEEIYSLLWDSASNGYSKVAKLLLRECKRQDIAISQEMEQLVKWKTQNWKRT